MAAVFSGPATTSPFFNLLCECEKTGLQALDFELPPELEAGEPAEARGLRRDQVRLMVSHISTDRIEHTRFHDLPRFLQPGDLLVINTSATINAALPVLGTGSPRLEVHLSTHLPGDLWVVELRQIRGEKNLPYLRARPGRCLELPDGGQIRLLLPYRPDQRRAEAGSQPVRLWLAMLHLPTDLAAYLERWGQPIRYSYVRKPWPLEDYQTVYAAEPGSAEMPSAGRAFTPEVITRLVAMGVLIAPLVLHTGVASLEAHEPPYEEYYRVPEVTARMANGVRASGGRVIAVGTTVVRALETVTGEDGRVHPGEGWTNKIITEDSKLRAVDGLLTGLHEPRSTHLAMLSALAGSAQLCKTYAAALEHRYLWHEFGDLHLILP